MPINPDFAADLRKRFAGDIRFDLASRVLYSTDASIYQIEPQGVVIPRTQDDVQLVVELAAKYRVPLTLRGAGTSLAGQAIGEGVIVDCSRWLDRILEIDSERRTARVEPGVILTDLNRRAAAFGLQFGPDPASAERASMGGVVANNATGAHSIIHGMTADHLISARVVMADGSTASLEDVDESRRPMANVGGMPGPDSSSCFDSLLSEAWRIRGQHRRVIEEGFPRAWRNSAGYRINYLLPWSASAPPRWTGAGYPATAPGVAFNLAQLLAGSEGTLAVIQDVTVRLVEKPKHTVLGILTYDDEAAACDAVPELLHLNPSAIELIPRLILDAARNIPGYAAKMTWLHGEPAALLVVEFAGDEPQPLLDRVPQLGPRVQVAATAEEQAMVWETRKAGLGLLDSRPRSKRPTAFIEDCAIPVENLGTYVRETRRLMQAHDAVGGIYGHASAGCLHTRPVLDLKTLTGVRALRQIAEETMRLSLRLGGAMSSEHGDGIARGEWLRQTYGPELSQAMLGLKRAADPQGILNPGKMLDAPPMDSHLRYGAAYRSHAWTPGIDFADAGGLGTAIEQCNGQGVCRKDTGVMCPSFQATREEMYSTRGRANLLRTLITTGWHGPDAAASGETNNGTTRSHQVEISDAVHEALDLCLGCKGCVAECPSGVDMAKLKSAFLEYRYQGRIRPVRDYLFGYFGATAEALAWASPVVVVAAKIRPLYAMGAGLLGITTRRPMPAFARPKSRPRPTSNAPSVLLLSDPFSHYVDATVEESALALLDSAGFRARTLSTIGLGTAMISKGFLGAARRHAMKLLDELTRIDPEGTLPIVMIEPSELSAMQNEFRDLMPSASTDARSRFARARSVEYFLMHSGKLPEKRSPSPHSRILFHPHCHEKAGLRSTDAGEEAYAGMALLRRAGYDVELIDAGCCGMGGTFGYEAEHYDISQKIGGLKLFPAIEAERAASVAATGGACRLQINQGTSKRAEHPLVLAARAFGLA